MLSALLGGTSHAVTLDLILHKNTQRSCKTSSKDGNDVKGSVNVAFQPNRTVEHNGVSIELIGRIEGKNSRGAHSFLTMSKDLAPGGILGDNAVYPFCFKATEFVHDTYNGINMKLRYFVRASITLKGHSTPLQRTIDLIVENVTMPPSVDPATNKDENRSTSIANQAETEIEARQKTGLVERQPDWATPIRMDVGIEDCLHMDVLFESSTLDCQDTLLGEIQFSLVRLRLKYMELTLTRQESVSTPTDTIDTGDALKFLRSSPTPVETQILTKYELMDGTPAKGTIIPLRMSLKGLGVTPTYLDVQNLFSVRYFVSLVLLDEDDRRYFKKQEIMLYRLPETSTGSKDTLMKAALGRCKLSLKPSAVLAA